MLYSLQTHIGLLDSKFEIHGTPAEVDQNDQGLVLTAPLISGEYETRPDKTYRLRHGNASGGFTLTIDTTVANEYRKKVGTKLIPGPTTHSVVTSESMALDGTKTPDHLEMLHPFVADDRKEGLTEITKANPVQVPYEEVTRLTGSSGSADILEGARDKPSVLQFGKIDGPVHYHLKRIEKPAKKPAEITEYDITADSVTADFSKPEGTITAIGHVHWVVSGEYNGTGDGDKVTITTDENRHPINVEEVGSPATMTMPIKPEISGGKGG